MEWPQAEYHKLFPERVLLACAGLSTLQFGAWGRIWLWLDSFTPAGLMVPMDLVQLEAWSGLPPRSWARERLAILGRFKFHPATGSLHDPPAQSIYWDWADVTLRKRAGGRASAAQRTEKRIGHAPPARFDSPYSAFRPPFWPIDKEHWEEIVKIVEEKASQARVLQDSSKTLQRVFDIRSTNSTTMNAGPPPPQAGGPGEIDTQPQVTSFIAGQSDEQLAELRGRWAAGAPDFFCEVHRHSDPRKSPMFASVLFNFACMNPSPAAAAEGGAAQAGGAA